MIDQESTVHIASGGPRAGRLASVLGIGFVVVALGLFQWPVLQGRFAVAAIGMFVLVLAWLRPAGFWNAPSVREWRRVLGDRLVLVIYLAVGIAGIIAAFKIPMR
jgi:uncharacterized membrane protein HdeD (DUF308 family)